MRLGDVMRDLLDRLPAAREVKREATATEAVMNRAILIRKTVERELGVSFQRADGRYAREAREGRRRNP